jgi:glyoxylase-like metal-dependent hydrolase (beta-lactamase superfamily II)
VTLVGSGALARHGPVHLCGDLYQVAGGDLTHPYDAGAYLLRGSECVLFDCGSVDGHSAMLANLRRLGVEPGDLAAVYATHGHYDHVSGLARLRALADVPLWLHAAEHGAVRSGDGLLTSAALLYDRAFPPLAVEHALRDGQTLPGDVRVIHTPGHSPGPSASCSRPAAAACCSPATRCGAASTPRSARTSTPGGDRSTGSCSSASTS